MINIDEILEEKINAAKASIKRLEDAQNNSEIIIPCSLFYDDIYGDFHYRSWDDAGFQEFIDYFEVDPMKIIYDLSCLIKEHGGEMNDMLEKPDPEGENFWTFFESRSDSNDTKDKGFIFDIDFSLSKKAFPELEEKLGAFSDYLIVKV